MRIKKYVEFKGIGANVSHYNVVSDDELLNLRREFYCKPDFSTVIKEIQSGWYKGGVKMSNIGNYYFKELMSKCVLYNAKWSVDDVFSSTDVMGIFKGRIYNQDFFKGCDFNVNSVMTAIRLGGKGIARKVSNYPVKSVDNLLHKYCTNGNYYDFSCGWGARLFSAMKNNVNYFGTDPNKELVIKLNEFKSDFRDSVIGYTATCDIRGVGSEEFQEDWVNTMSFAFSSPPYFKLEDYGYVGQSIDKNPTLDEWIDNYLTATLKNAFLYLVDCGTLAINIKDYDGIDLVNNTIKVAESVGFTFTETVTLKNITRPVTNLGRVVSSDEEILIFKK